MKAQLTGAFPRSEALVDLTRAAARGRIQSAELEAGYAREVSTVVNMQSEAGLDLVVDGQLTWKDLFRPFSEMFEGIRTGALTRWFNNNTFYRKPVIADKIRYRGRGLEAYFRYNELPKGGRRKAILPGPYTFAVMAHDQYYSTPADLIDDLAHSLREAVDDLKKTGGYDCFQFNEPCISFQGLTRVDIPALAQAYEELTKGLGAESILQTYFGDATPVIDTVLDLPVDHVGIDFYATPLDSLAGHDFTKGIMCGCVDARNSLLESPDALKKLILQIEDRLNPKSLSIAPNCDLDFLPQTIAMKKLVLLARAKELVE